MIYFFKPNSKVQRDRHILRETDSRMAKYSRRGLIFNFLAYLLCIFEGKFVAENPTMAIILTVGLLVITCVRAWYVFRFDFTYPRAPARWRNGYFASTLFGAMWWGLILSSVTYAIGLQFETPLIWIYTVVFFSTTAHAFAPFHGFLGYYQFFGLVPAAAAAFLIGGWNGYIYGTLMMFFYLILVHQCRLISNDYWEKLETSFSLSRKAMHEEEERRENRENLQLTKEFLSTLNTELGLLSVSEEDEAQSKAPKLKEIVENIGIVGAVVNKNIVIEKHVFNIRHEIQHLVSRHIEAAEIKQIQLESSLSPTLPMRLSGDAKRFAKIVDTLLDSMIRCSQNSTLMIEIQFLREYEKAGELIFTIRRSVQSSKLSFFSENPNKPMENSLDIVTAKALADTMGGDVEIIESVTGETHVRFEARLDISDLAGHLDFHRGRFSGSNILLVNSSPIIVDIKQQELSALGFKVTTETQFKRAKQIAINAVRSGKPIEYILVYFESANPNSVDLIEQLANDDELNSINKIIACTPLQQKSLSHITSCDLSGFNFVAKPVGLFELESTFDAIASKGTYVEEQFERESAEKVIFFQCDENFDSLVCIEDKSLSKIALHVENISDLISKLKTGVAEQVVIFCSSDEDFRPVVTAVREIEDLHTNDCFFIPIIGVGLNCSEDDIEAFESGLDDFIDLAGFKEQSLSRRLRYWASLQH
ncbi:MAG: CheY-like chemotaxis protein [Flavobacteriales bacterium]|jgi:CheY-like chemotaxis protein